MSLWMFNLHTPAVRRSVAVGVTITRAQAPTTLRETATEAGEVLQSIAMRDGHPVMGRLPREAQSTR